MKPTIYATTIKHQTKFAVFLLNKERRNQIFRRRAFSGLSPAAAIETWRCFFALHGKTLHSEPSTIKRVVQTASRNCTLLLFFPPPLFPTCQVRVVRF
jgi:hypothetical protein